MTEDASRDPSATTSPTPPDGDPPAAEVVDLVALAERLLTQAHDDAHGRASAVVVKGPRQRALLMALTTGSALGEHTSPPAASLQVVSGSVRLHSAEHEWVVAAGHLVPIPPDRHAVDALEDSVFLLTVSLDPTG